jgi:hypothetical protein
MASKLECSFIRRVSILPIKDYKTYDERIKIYTDTLSLDIPFMEMDYIQTKIYTWIGSLSLHNFIMSIVDREEGDEIYPLSKNQLRKIYDTLSRALLTKKANLLGAVNFTAHSDRYQNWYWSIVKKMVGHLSPIIKDLDKDDIVSDSSTFYYQVNWTD